MLKAPQIPSEDLKSMGDEVGLVVFNREYLDGLNYVVIKDSSTNIDTAFNYLDPGYDAIISKFSGSVLILGLGVGRGIVEACAKKKVKEVTVVEKDIRIINLFWKLHGRDFKGVKKLSIIEGDAREYDNTEYDHVFIDIFHTPLDKKIYRKEMGELRERFESQKVHFIDLY